MQTRNDNFVNPPNPLLRIYLSMFIVLVSLNSTISKDIDSLPSLPPVQELELSCKTYHNMRYTALLQEWEVKEKGKVLKYLPNIGFTFGLPSVSLGTDKILTAKQQKEVIKAKKKSLELEHTLNLNDDLGKIKIMYQNINYLLSNIYSEKELIQVEKDLFEIYEKQYKNHEITPTEYLQKKKAYLVVNQGFRNKIEDIRKLINELLLFAHFGTPQEEIYFTLDDCDMLEMRKLQQKKVTAEK